MDFVLDDKYLLKSLVELIRGEGTRIVSSGLASGQDMKRAVDQTLDTAMKSVGKPDEIIHVLSDLHHDLTCVKLPGDFDHLRVEAVEEVIQDEPAVKEIKQSDESVVISVLETMAYELGKKGNHDAAYIIERAMRDIDEIQKQALDDKLETKK